MESESNSESDSEEINQINNNKKEDIKEIEEKKVEVKEKVDSEKKNINRNKEKGTIDIPPLSNIYNNDKNYKDKGNLDNNIKKISEDSIIFNGKEFKNYNRINMYNTKRKIKNIIYKCINLRKDEKLRKETGQKKYCTATLEYI